MILFLIGCPDLEIIKLLRACPVGSENRTGVLRVLVYPVAPADGTGAVQKQK